MAVHGFRSLLAVPILRGDTPVGVIVIYRPEPGPFSDEHISLLQTFAEQAVIAIEMCGSSRSSRPGRTSSCSPSRANRTGGVRSNGLHELVRPGLELLEEPHILDRDHGLFREGLEE